MSGARGQAAVETMLLAAMAVAALVAMALYGQRAYQGYLYSNSASQGPQFDPTQTSTDTRTLDGFASNQLITVAETAPVYTLPGGVCVGVDCLPDRPAAAVGGRMLKTTTRTRTDFAVSRSATFDAQ